MTEKGLVAVMISITVVNLGVLFEHKTWVYWAEWLRIVLYPLGLVVLSVVQAWPSYVWIAAFGYLIVSVIWYSRIPKSYAKA